MGAARARIYQGCLQRGTPKIPKINGITALLFHLGMLPLLVPLGELRVTSEPSWVPLSSFIMGIPGFGKSSLGDALEESGLDIREASFPRCYFIKSLKDTSLIAPEIYNFFFFFMWLGLLPNLERAQTLPQVQSRLESSAPPGIRDNWDELVQRSRSCHRSVPSHPGDHFWLKGCRGTEPSPARPRSPQPVPTRRCGCEEMKGSGEMQIERC